MGLLLIGVTGYTAVQVWQMKSKGFEEESFPKGQFNLVDGKIRSKEIPD